MNIELHNKKTDNSSTSPIQNTITSEFADRKSKRYQMRTISWCYCRWVIMLHSRVVVLIEDASMTEALMKVVSV